MLGTDSNLLDLGGSLILRIDPNCSAGFYQHLETLGTIPKIRMRQPNWGFLQWSATLDALIF